MRVWRDATELQVRIVLVVLGGMAVLFYCSWDALTPTQYGLRYNWLTKHMSEDVYEAGRHMIGFTSRFVSFPMTLVTIEFSHKKSANAEPLDTRTQEGLELKLEISFQYKLIKSEIPTLFRDFFKQYEPIYVNIARESILQSASLYYATDWFVKRKTITDQMLHTLNAELKEVHAEAVHIQLMSIDLPNSWEHAIEQTLVEQQNVKISQFEQLGVVIRSNTRRLQALAAASVVAVNASASAQNTGIYNLKDIKSMNATQLLLASSYSTLKSACSYNVSQLMLYLKIKAIRRHRSSSLVLNLPGDHSRPPAIAPPRITRHPNGRSTTAEIPVRTSGAALTRVAAERDPASSALHALYPDVFSPDLFSPALPVETREREVPPTLAEAPAPSAHHTRPPKYSSHNAATSNTTTTSARW